MRTRTHGLLMIMGLLDTACGQSTSKYCSFNKSSIARVVLVERQRGLAGADFSPPLRDISTGYMGVYLPDWQAIGALHVIPEPVHLLALGVKPYQ